MSSKGKKASSKSSSARAGSRRVSRPRDAREIKAITFILGGVFGGLYIATWLTMVTVSADDNKIADEQSILVKLEREQYAKELADAEFDERAGKIMPIIDNVEMAYDKQAAALKALDLKFEANWEFANEEAERLTNLSTSCSGN